MVAAVHDWVEKAVIGLKLCPFAEAEVRRKRLRVVVSSGTSEKEITDDLFRELEALVTTPPEVLGTTILVTNDCDHLRDDFENFFMYCEWLDDSLDRAQRTTAGVTSVWSDNVMCVGFHPAHVYGGESADAAINYDKRAPFPLINVLRTPAVDAQINSGATSTILEDNQQTLDKLGPDYLSSLFASFKRAP